MPLELIPPEQQKIRKKEEEKPSIPRIHKERIHIPKMIPSEKEIRAGAPIIPGDPCCANICETLNNDIDKTRDTLRATISLGGEKIYRSAIYRSLIYRVEALEGYRQDLKDQNGCGCIAETGAVSIIVPLVQASKAREGIPLRGIRFISPSIKRAKRLHLGEKSIIPPTNSCCPLSCKILNKTIDSAVKILDNMELRGGPEATKNPRYEALSSKALALQDYRSDLKDRGSCKCVE